MGCKKKVESGIFYGQSVRKMSSELPLPVVDLDGEDVGAMKKGLFEYGFFYLQTSLFDAELIDRVYSESRSFFTQPTDVKLEAKANEFNRGYTRHEEEVLDPAHQKGGDRKEGYYIGRDQPAGLHPMSGPNVWPRSLEKTNWRATMEQYFELVCTVGFRTCQLLALALDLERTFFDEFLTEPMALLRLLHYSAEHSDPQQGVFGAGAHTDYGLLTLLSTDGVPGLQVYLKGEWVPVVHVPGTWVVNIGDMVQRWTNDHVRSTIHRVVNVSGLERYSVPFFYEPNFHTKVECLPNFCKDHPARYPPTTSGQHLLDRYSQTHTEFVDPRAEQEAAAS